MATPAVKVIIYRIRVIAVWNHKGNRYPEMVRGGEEYIVFLILRVICVQRVA